VLLGDIAALGEMIEFNVFQLNIGIGNRQAAVTAGAIAEGAVGVWQDEFPSVSKDSLEFVLLVM